MSEQQIAIMVILGSRTVKAYSWLNSDQEQRARYSKYSIVFASLNQIDS